MKGESNHTEVDAIERSNATTVSEISQELETNNNIQSPVVNTEESNNGQETIANGTFENPNPMINNEIANGMFYSSFY
jgi:hypothetical protein